MTVDKFGRSSFTNNKGLSRGQPGIGFKLTSKGDYDMENKVLKNLKLPVDNNDGVPKLYVDKNSPNKNIAFMKKIQTEIKVLSELYEEWEKKGTKNISEDEFRNIIYRIIFIQKMYSIILANPDIPVV